MSKYMRPTKNLKKIKRRTRSAGRWKFSEVDYQILGSQLGAKLISDLPTEMNTNKNNYLEKVLKVDIFSPVACWRRNRQSGGHNGSKKRVKNQLKIITLTRFFR